jgi:hypothetical protein
MLEGYLVEEVHVQLLLPESLHFQRASWQRFSYCTSLIKRTFA